MEPDFITKENLQIAKKRMGCMGLEKEYIDMLSVENACESFFEDIRNHFRHLIKE